MATAPRPMSEAQRKPRRAPSFMMVRLIGPTGIERSSPLINPVRAASKLGCRSNIVGGRIFVLVLILVILVLDLVPNLARNAGPNESINEVAGEKQRQNDRQQNISQDH